MNEIGFLLIVAVLGGLVSGFIAQSKGLSSGGYFVLGFLLPIVGVLVALVSQSSTLGRLRPADDRGWWPDPTGRFEYRYFDGKHWTRDVGRSGKQYEDPI